jgi:hypothetical protein
LELFQGCCLIQHHLPILILLVSSLAPYPFRFSFKLCLVLFVSKFSTVVGGLWWFYHSQMPLIELLRCDLGCLVVVFTLLRVCLAF